jgi:hypothetical protein
VFECEIEGIVTAGGKKVKKGDKEVCIAFLYFTFIYSPETGRYATPIRTAQVSFTKARINYAIGEQ